MNDNLYLNSMICDEDTQVIRLRYDKMDTDASLPVHPFNNVVFFFLYCDELVYIAIKDNCVWAYRHSDIEPRLILDITYVPGNIKICEILAEL